MHLKTDAGKRKTRTVHKNNWFARFLVVHFVINPSKKGQKVKEKKKKIVSLVRLILKVKVTLASFYVFMFLVSNNLLNVSTHCQKFPLFLFIYNQRFLGDFCFPLPSNGMSHGLHNAYMTFKVKKLNNKQ